MPSKYPYTPGNEAVPGYHLVRLLGKGNFGEVWHAKAPGGASVALKIIPDLSSTQGRKEFRSLSITKHLHHPNLIPINAIWLKDGDGRILDDSVAAGDELPDAFVFNDQLKTTLAVPPPGAEPVSCELIIAMGLGQKNLYSRLQECTAQGLEGIPPAELLDYMDESAKAIDYLNNASSEGGTTRPGIQHCDIKPHNILITGKSAQVCDFGLARVQGAARATSTMAATVAYAAPESLEQPGGPSPTTDQYSLAITYYELRTGRLPYDQDSLYPVIQAILAGNLNFSHATPAEERVLRKATARDPRARFPSASAMAKALRDASLGGIVPGPDNSHGFWRRRTLLVMGVVTMTTLVGFWAYGYYHVVPEKPQADGVDRSDTGTEVADELIEAADDLVTRGNPDAAILKYDRAITLSPDKAEAYFGRGMACALAKDLDKSTALDQAIGNFETARELDRGRKFEGRLEPVRALLERAQLRRHDGDPERASYDCTVVIKQYPHAAAAAYTERGACDRDQNKFVEAIEDFNEAIQRSPEDSLAFGRRGECYLRINKLDAAIRDFDEAIRLDPIEGDYLNRAIAYSLKKTDAAKAKAVLELNAILHRDPNNAEARYQLGLIYCEQKKFQQALAIFTEVSELEPENERRADALAHRSLLLAAGPDATQSSAAQAVPLATKACTLSNWKDAEHLNSLAAAFAKSGDFNKAIQIAEIAIKAAGSDQKQKSTCEERLALYQSGQPYALRDASCR